MKAGFARVAITPPLGTTMYGFAARDRERGCETIHDDLYVRALYLDDRGQEALVLAYDLLFLGRPEVDRLRGAVGRGLDLAPARILLNTSHTHSGPVVGTTWSYADYDRGPDRFYEDELAAASVQAATAARAAAVDVTVRTGAGRTTVPLSRRRKDAAGNVRFAPAPEGVVCDHLPVADFRDPAGETVCLLFSVSCHPSTIGGFEISADYPGAAMAALDARLGKPCSLFLQGAGGDTKPAVVGQGERWRSGTWADVATTGETVAREVSAVLDAGLTAVPPRLRCAAFDMAWPLAPLPTRPELEAIAGTAEDDVRRRWAMRQLELLDRGRQLPSSVPIALHALQLGEGLRLVGLEGEAVAELGLLMLDFYRDHGVTFPLGYTDGARLYLPTSAMLAEGGYEAASAYEYGLPANLAGGVEQRLLAALARLRAAGID